MLSVPPRLGFTAPQVAACPSRPGLHRPVRLAMRLNSAMCEPSTGPHSCSQAIGPVGELLVEVASAAERSASCTARVMQLKPVGDPMHGASTGMHTPCCTPCRWVHWHEMGLAG